MKTSSRDWADDVAEALGVEASELRRRLASFEAGETSVTNGAAAAYAAAYHAGLRAPIDWTGRSAEEVAAALDAAPRVYRPWEALSSAAPGWARFAVYSGKTALAKLDNDGKFWWQILTEKATLQQTKDAWVEATSLEAARAAADAALLAKGALLMKADG